MNVLRFLEVNGALQPDHEKKWFQLPETTRSARSVRFGNHTLVADKTVQILPIGDQRQLQRNPPKQSARPPLWISWLDMLISSNKSFSFPMQRSGRVVSRVFMTHLPEESARFLTTFTRLFHNCRIHLQRRTLNREPCLKGTAP
ncbi:MAG: hypothetical protein HYV36_00100 [Lentisphaerae bacterium]|nr:hypothetical protein [Lentisphaerota bacterium]